MTPVTIQDITNDMPEFCSQCCNDDPKKRASSVGLLEYLQQRMRREGDISSFVVEAVKRDADSTFWDYTLIEKILEAGANTDFLGLNATLLEELISSASNKIDADTDSVLQLLKEHGVTIDPRIIRTCLPVPNTSIEYDMRSNFGMDYALALTQLIHYGFVSVSTVYALSHKIRHTANNIDTWIDLAVLMANLIDDIDCSIRNHTPSTVQLLGQCRKDSAKLHTLLTTCRKYTLLQKRSKESGPVFVIRKEEKVERIMSSYRNNFNILASYIAV